MAISSDQIYLITQSKGSILITAYKINWFEDGGPRLDTLKLLTFSGVLLLTTKNDMHSWETCSSNTTDSSDKHYDIIWDKISVKIQIGAGRPNKVKQHIRFHVRICTAGEFQVRHLQVQDDIEIRNTKPEVSFVACLISTVLQTESSFYQSFGELYYLLFFSCCVDTQSERMRLDLVS